MREPVELVAQGEGEAGRADRTCSGPCFGPPGPLSDRGLPYPADFGDAA